MLFIGYCGWNQDELEKEIEEGSWEVIDPTKA
ncbi:MAG: YqgE/AlgH family protein [Chitinophagaceae bacterium]